MSGVEKKGLKLYSSLEKIETKQRTDLALHLEDACDPFCSKFISMRFDLF